MKKHHKIFTSKIVLALLVVMSGLFLLDNLMAVKTKKEFLVSGETVYHSGKYGGKYKNFIINTQNFKFEVNNMFYYRMNDSFPFTMTYSPLFNFVKKVKAVNSDDNKTFIECNVKNSVYTDYWFLPLIVFVLAGAGLFINDEQADATLVGVLIFFSVVVGVALFSFVA